MQTPETNDETTMSDTKFLTMEIAKKLVESPESLADSIC